MVLLINLMMFGGAVALFSIPILGWRYLNHPDMVYARAVSGLVKKSRKAVSVGDLAARDRYNYALTALAQEKNNKAGTFETQNDNPLGLYGVGEDGLPRLD